MLIKYCNMYLQNLCSLNYGYADCAPPPTPLIILWLYSRIRDTSLAGCQQRIGINTFRNINCLPSSSISRTATTSHPAQKLYIAVQLAHYLHKETAWFPASQPIYCTALWYLSGGPVPLRDTKHLKAAYTKPKNRPKSAYAGQVFFTRN